MLIGKGWKLSCILFGLKLCIIRCIATVTHTFYLSPFLFPPPFLTISQRRLFLLSVEQKVDIACLQGEAYMHGFMCIFSSQTCEHCCCATQSVVLILIPSYCSRQAKTTPRRNVPILPAGWWSRKCKIDDYTLKIPVCTAMFQHSYIIQ